jgi:hypothetical protein
MSLSCSCIDTLKEALGGLLIRTEEMLRVAVDADARVAATRKRREEGG